MLEKVLDYERELFLTLNGHHTDFWDNVMFMFSGKMIWIPLIIFIFIVLTYKISWKESLLVLLGIALVVLFCDQFTSHICKPYFARFRPTHHPDFMNEVKTVFGYRGGLYGFISGHAANSFGVATFMALLFRRGYMTCFLYLWAAIMAYTRIYLGVHFITDIIPGLLSGLVFGTLSYYIYTFARKRLLFKGRGEVTPSSAIYSEKRQWLILFGTVFTIVIMLVFNAQLAPLLS